MNFKTSMKEYKKMKLARIAFDKRKSKITNIIKLVRSYMFFESNQIFFLSVS